MKRTSLVTIAAVFLFLWAFSGIAAADKCVRFPYAVQNPATGWATGIAITNYTSSDITDLTLDIVKSNGEYYVGGVGAKALGNDREDLATPFTVTNYRTNLGTLDPFAMKVGTLSSLYGKTLPSDPNGRYWVEIWHAGASTFGVCLFVVNTNSGAGEGFGFQTYESVTRAHTFPEHTELLD